MPKRQPIIRKVSDYYSEKILTYGPTPQGVDWNSAASQQLRFEQLMKIIPDRKSRFSILDYGCGYGSLAEFLGENYAAFSYTGFDISDAMITEAKKKQRSKKNLWTTDLKTIAPHDYAVASGVINVKLNFTQKEWENYVISVLHQLDDMSKKGFSFNALTKYSDTPKMKEYLYYADPEFLFGYCKKKFSKYVALLHDYPLYEFTILVKKF